MEPLGPTFRHRTHVSILTPHHLGLTSCLCPSVQSMSGVPPPALRLSLPHSLPVLHPLPSLPLLGFPMICTKESCVGPAEGKSKDVLCSQSGASEWCAFWIAEPEWRNNQRQLASCQSTISQNKERLSLPTVQIPASLGHRKPASVWLRRGVFCGHPAAQSTTEYNTYRSFTGWNGRGLGVEQTFTRSFISTREKANSLSISTPSVARVI